MNIENRKTLLFMYNSKKELLRFYRGEKKSSLTNLLIKSVKEEIKVIEDKLVKSK